SGAPAERGYFSARHADGFPHERRASQEAEARPAASGSTARGLLGSLGSAVEGELDKVKGVAVSLLAAAVRDLVKPALPEPVQEKAVEIIDDLTRKLGGEPIRGPLFTPGSGHSGEQPSQQSREADWGYGDNPAAHRSSLGSL